MASRITEKIYSDLQERNERGLNKYGHYLDDNNYQDMIQHAYEEALDLSQYLAKEIETRQTIQKLIATNPTNAKLGQLVREMFSK